MDHEKTNYDIIVSILEWIVKGEHEVPIARQNVDKIASCNRVFNTSERFF